MNIKEIIKTAKERYPYGGASYRGEITEEERTELEKECFITCTYVRINGNSEWIIKYKGEYKYEATNKEN